MLTMEKIDIHDATKQYFDNIIIPLFNNDLSIEGIGHDCKENIYVYTSKENINVGGKKLEEIIGKEYLGYNVLIKYIGQIIL